MKKSITVRGIDNHEAAKRSHSVKNYIEDHFGKIEKLLRHVGEPVNVDMVAEIIRPHPDHHFTVRIRAPHFNVIVKRDGPELYKVIDEVMDITIQELIKHKDKVVTSRHHKKVES